jgi:2'-5' RNA ligase
MDKRLFVAIKINPSEAFLQRIYLLKENLKVDNINWIREDHYHITLKFLGKTTAEIIPQIMEKLRDIASNMGSFPISVDKLGLFGSKYHPRVIWLAIQDSGHITRLHYQLQSQLKSLGFSHQAGSFIPHLSIARIRKIEDKSYFHQVMAKFENGTIQAQNIEKVLLYESILSSKGAEYQVLGEFPLAEGMR